MGRMQGQGVDLWNAIVVANVANNANTYGLEALFAQVDQLSVNEKAELVKRLLNNSGLNVELRNNQLSSSIIAQLNMMDRSSLSDVLQAIANRIANDG